jgi:hypothetical protein
LRVSGCEVKTKTELSYNKSLESWSNGVVEYWDCKSDHLIYTNIPSLQYSNAP